MIKLKVVKCLKTHFKTENLEYVVKFATGESPFGLALVATVADYVVFLKFFESLTDKQAEEIINNLHPDAKSVDKVDQDDMKQTIDLKNLDKLKKDVNVVMKGTEMQEKVWNELLKVKSGETLHYSDVAERAGYSVGASRAVGAAMKQNCVGYLIPCHRVLKKTADPLNYSCGPVSVRRRMLKHEGIDV